MVQFIKNKVTNKVEMVLEERELKEDEVLLKANTSDGALEKHVPVVKVEKDSVHVEVGEVTHPMSEEHHIAFIALITDKKSILKELDHTSAPKADFTLAEGEKVIAAYEYCNLHGLWVKNVD